ncbi:MAG: divergent polysaccharide deacetylase family protein [Calditrichaeota bacterium]|nr:divergent polysaccharide deacetylase family protein [Calditrichota bacterium]
MTEKKRKKRKFKGLNWRWGLIIPVIGIAVGVWLIKPWESTKQPTRVYDWDIKFSDPLPEQDLKLGIEDPFFEMLSAEKPWVALIIDDFGPFGTARMVKGFMELPFNVTCSILPGNRKSIAIDEAVQELGGESLIHMPMEPMKKEAMDERDMLYVGVDSLELNILLDRVTADLKYAVGMNNHMGSLATSDYSLMRMLAKELKARDLFYIDSRTVPHSRAKPAMEYIGVPVLGRDIFIDNIADSTEMVKQLNLLIGKAKTRGWTIGIAHARSSTLAILKEVAPNFQDSGVEFVTASKLVEAIQNKRNAEIAAKDSTL